MPLNKNFLEVKYHLTGKAGLVSYQHTHDCIEIIHCLIGDGHVLCNGSIYPLKSNTVYFIDANKPHYIQPFAPESYVRNKIIISSVFFSRLFSLLGVEEFLSSLMNGLPVHLDMSSLGDAIDRMFFEMQTEAESFNEYSDAFLTAHVLGVLSKIYHGTSHETKFNPLGGIAELLLNYICEHECEQELSVGKICGALHIDKSYACHRFKEVTGDTIMNYIARRKMYRAKIMLGDFNLSVEDIALDLGYATNSSFTRAFHRIIGCTPLQYRAQIQKSSL